MGNFLVRYASRVIVYNHRAVIRLVTSMATCRVPKGDPTRDATASSSGAGRGSNMNDGNRGATDF